MKVELPEFKRCCFCLPLRYGLITWGYIKLAFHLFISVPLLIRLYYTARNVLLSVPYISIEDLVSSSLLLLIILMEICFGIVFLVGGHQKSAKLLHIYFICSIVMLCLFVFMFTLQTGMGLVAMGRYVDNMPHGYIFLVFSLRTQILMGIFVIASDGYTILLVRSEVNKLKNRSEFRFGNPTVETQGKLETGIDYQFEVIINEKTDRGDFSCDQM